MTNLEKNTQVEDTTPDISYKNLENFRAQLFEGLEDGKSAR